MEKNSPFSPASLFPDEVIQMEKDKFIALDSFLRQSSFPLENRQNSILDVTAAPLWPVIDKLDYDASTGLVTCEISGSLALYGTLRTTSDCRTDFRGPERTTIKKRFKYEVQLSDLLKLVEPDFAVYYQDLVTLLSAPVQTLIPIKDNKDLYMFEIQHDM